MADGKEDLIEFRVINNNNLRESSRIVAGLKCIYQRQSPLLPESHIASLVNDKNYISIAIVKPPFEALGGVTYRPFNERGFAQILFCAVSAGHCDKRYGADLIARLKDYIKATSPIKNLLIYTDTYAIGFFKKKGFTEEITLDESLYMGLIQEYEGATIMQCSITPQMTSSKDHMLQKQKGAGTAEIRPKSFNSHDENFKKPQNVRGLNAEVRSMIQNQQRQLELQAEDARRREALLVSQLEQQQKTSKEQWENSRQLLNGIMEMLQEQREENKGLREQLQQPLSK